MCLGCMSVFKFVDCLGDIKSEVTTFLIVVIFFRGYVSEVVVPS